MTIKGTLDAKWKASYMIFNKLTNEGYSGHDDMRLRTAMRVPRAMVGRVIGKQGNRVSSTCSNFPYSFSSYFNLFGCVTV